MRTLSFFLLFTCLSSISLLAQNYPENPEPGACYVRCAIEEITEMAKVITTPTYMEYKVVPAEYKTVTEQVLVKEASKRFEYVPAVYREVIDTIMVLEPESQYSIHPVKTIDTIEVFEVEPAFSRFESRPSLDGCDSPNPGDCDVICYVTYPAVTKIIPIKKIGAWPYYEPATPKPAKYKYVKRQVVQTPATVREIEIPAEYVTVQKQVLVQDAHVDSTEIKPIEREEVFLVSDRGNNNARERYEWRRIECELLDYNLLPIHYNVNSTALTSEAKKVIDEKLLKLLLARPELRVEINSHTDSRASDDFNLQLSEKRALNVVDYLVSKGIKRSRLEYHGYGETQLVNQCANGVECTEEEHAANRRTEFRVLPR